VGFEIYHAFNRHIQTRSKGQKGTVDYQL